MWKTFVEIILKFQYYLDFLESVNRSFPHIFVIVEQ